jgi:hypothetical protein
MAAIYDALGNVIGDDGAPSLDQMKLELTKSNRLTPQQAERFVAPPPLASQISGYDKPIPPAQTPTANPLESAAGNFTQLATNFNPLMMMKSMREAAGILTVPPVAAIKGVGESIFASPPGTYTSGKAPDYAEKVAKQFMEQNAPQTPVTQAFANAISPVMADLPAYLGHLQTGRPALTPNDVRVMGAEATRMGRQVRDIPSDFANAQSGMQRIDPITGQPTYGVKLQGAAQSVGDIMAQREMQGLPPIPGLPASMQPMNPKLYAMRPEGSRIQNAVVPSTAASGAATHTPVQDLIQDFVKTEPLTPIEVLDEVQNNVLSRERAQPARDAFTNFLKQKANEMYPDAPSESAALAAYKMKFGNKAASAPNTLDLYYQFLQTPEGIQYRAQYNLPSPDEVAARHDAANQWLQSQFANYINEKVGTPDEPAAKLASQGFTFAKPEDILESSQFSTQNIQAKRMEAGMPPSTAIDIARNEASQKLSDLTVASANAEANKRAQQAAALEQGYGAVDPNTGLVAEGMNMGRYEPFAQASREASKAAAALAKQQQKYDNLNLGSAYERATDIAISAPTAKNLREGLEYRERQFYPSLMRTPDDERVYTASVNQLKNLGFDELAKNFYNDVMSGAIPLDKVPKMTVENYIRQTAEKRINEEKIAKAKTAEFKRSVDDKFLETANKYIPLEKTYRNVGALEITNKFTPEEVGRIASEITLALDVCIGEGGSAVDMPNYWHPGTGNRQYEPIYNVLTGERNPKATSPRMTFINAVKKGDQMIDFRDIATGVPAAVFQFEKLSPNKFHLGFASGRGNQYVQPQYAEGIKDYLNSRSDQIETTSGNLEKNLSIYDRKRVNTPTLAQAANVPTSEFRNLDLNSLPRFVTSRDLQEFVANIAANGQQPVVPTIVDQRPSESTAAYTTSIVSSAIDNVLESQRRAFETGGIEDRFQRSEDFFADIRAHFNEALREHGPVPAFEMTIQELMGLEGQYSNSNQPSRQLISQGIIDLIQHLDLTSEYVRLRAAADVAQARQAPMRQGDPIPDMDAEDLLYTYRNRLTPEQEAWLNRFSDRWEGPDGSSDVQQAAMIREFALWRDNNRLAPLPQSTVQYLRMTHDAFMDTERVMGLDVADEMRAIVRNVIEQQGIDPQTDPERFVTALRMAADSADRGTVEIALNDLSDRLETAHLQDWEPDVTHPANAPTQQAPVSAEQIRNRLSDQSSQIFFEMRRDGLDPAAIIIVRDTLSPLYNSYIDNDRFLSIPAERLRSLLGELGQQIELLEMQGANEQAAASRLSDYHNDIEYALRDLQQPAPAQQPQNIVPRGNDIDPEELRDAFLSGARVRLDDRNYEIVRDHVQGIGQYINSRDEPEEFVSMVRQAADMVLDANARDLLQSYANQIENLYGPPTRAAEEFIPATQDQMQGIGQAIDNVLNRQLQRLRDAGNNGAADIFVATYPTLLRENNLDGMLIEESNPANFGRALQGFSDDLTAQLPNLRTGGDQHRAAALAIENVIETISNFLPYLRNEPENLNQAQAEQSLITDIRSLLDNPDLNPEDLRAIASDMEPFSNNPDWYALSEQTRRTAMRQLRERANYIEFSPADFAIRLSNEAGTDIPELRDTVQALNDGTFDHEILRGLPAIERDRAAQRTALNLNHILQGMQADAQQRGNDNQPPAPRAITRQQQAIIDRVPQITDMLIDFSVDDPIETAADYRRIANILRDPRNAREFLEDVMDVGSSLGDFTLRPSDLRSSTLRLVADELEHRAENWVATPVGPLMTDNELYNIFADIIRTAIRDEGFESANYSNADLAMLVADDQIGGLDDLTPEQRARLSIIVRERGFGGNANGGLVRGYQKGGSVKKDDVPTPSLFSVSDYSNFTAKDMYPGKVGIDDQRDAARHMLAAGTLARKYNPWIAEKLGQAHEIKSSPIQHIKSLFGAEMPPDYYMDRHNNEVGSRLGRQAKSQSELEDLVQAEAERASRTKTPGQAFILKANGGIVQQNPTTDQMRYELMMRRK